MRDAWELIDLEGVKWKCKMLLEDALETQDILDGEFGGGWASGEGKR